MADRYWVGSGSWSSTNTTNWSTSSGGSGGASVPTSADNVFFTGSSGTCNNSIGYVAQCLTISFSSFANSFGVNSTQIAATSGTVFVGGSTAAFFSATFEITSTGSSDITVTNSVSSNPPSFSFTGGTYTLNLPGRALNLNFTGFSGLVNNSAVFIHGNLTASTGMTFGSGGNTWTFAGSSTQSITSNGKTMDFPITISPSFGVTIQLLDALTLGSTRTLTLSGGTFNANNFNVTVGIFSSSNTNTRTLTMGSGTWTLAAGGLTVWDTNTSTNLTLNANTSTISVTSASGKTFNGGGKTYYNLNQGGTGNLTINGSNTFNNITNSVQPATIIFASSTTTTVSNFGLSGTLNNLITLQTNSPGNRFTISKSSGTVTPQYLSIKDSAATGGATWIAQNSTNAGNNTGWSIIPAAGFFMLF
jgi:hypothetical protein